jgi:3-deoxy-D-manno-octulosonic acid kinase
MPGRQDKLAPRLEVVERRSDDGRVALLADRELVEALVGRGLLRDAPLETIAGAQPTDFGGRGRPVRLELPGARLVAKAMRHGGLVGGLLGERFAGAERARRLVALLERLDQRAVPTPRFGFARVRRGGAGLVRLDVATREIEGARDGLAFLRSRPAAPVRREAVRSAARVVRALHDAGVEHADLNVKNLLVSAGPPLAAYVIDLEKSRATDSLPAGAAARNLERLARSLAKLRLLGDALPRTELVRFVREYAGRDWRSLFEAARRRHDAFAPLHRLAWTLFGRTPSA